MPIFSRPAVPIGLAMLGFFLLLNLYPGIPGGDDGYRHLKMAQLIAEDWQNVKADPWHLVYLWPKPVDVWLGFELLLAPFTLFFPPLLALKLFMTLIFGATVFAFYRLLRLLGSKHPLLWTAILCLGSNAFLTRALFSRPQTLSLLLLLAAAIACYKRRPGWLFILSALYSLSYSAMFLVLVVPLVFLFRADKRFSLKYSLFSLSGVAVGIIANPYFPESFYFSLTQSFAPIIVRLLSDLNIGSELYTLSPLLFWQEALIFTLWGLAMMFFLAKKSRAAAPLEELRPWFLLALGFLLLAILAQKFLDHFTAFALVFSALILEPKLSAVNWQALRAELLVKRSRRLAFGLAAVMLMTLGMNLADLSLALVRQPPLNFYKPVSEYLLINSPPRAVVLNLQWGAYPQLFYWNSQSTYFTGMDPTFFYLLDRPRYWLWRHISDDESFTCENPVCGQKENSKTAAQALQGELVADYVLFENRRNPKLNLALAAAPGVEKVFADINVTLYKIARE